MAPPFSLSYDTPLLWDTGEAFPPTLRLDKLCPPPTFLAPPQPPPFTDFCVTSGANPKTLSQVLRDNVMSAEVQSGLSRFFLRIAEVTA